MRRIWVALVACGLMSLIAWSQASTGGVSGRVADPSGAVVVGAKVSLLDTATGAVKTATTNSSGRFLFPGLALGTYQLTITANGFQTTTVTSIPVTVNHTAVENVSLQVGASTQTVTVQSTAGTNLRMTNATVGTAFSGQLAQLLPNQNRDVTSLLLTQPMTTPPLAQANGNNLMAGQVAGQMSDQNAYTLDGADASSDTEGNNSYVSFGSGGEAAIPTPVESIQEFRVSTNNMGANFSTSAGGEMALVTKRGTNKWHGSVYDFYQADELNAQGWGFNQTHYYTCYVNNVYTPSTPGCVQKQEMHRNRFGASLGGPMLPKFLGGKTYFYFNYEGRRFPRQEIYSHSVPSASMRLGTVKFADAAGNVVSYNLNNSTQCAGPNGAGGQACDPRGLGLNPEVASIWDKYMPLPNQPMHAVGNGLNIGTYSANLSLPIVDNFAVMRVDHDFGSNWRMNAVYRYFSEAAPTDSQVDIGGLYPGDKLGVPTSLSSNPFQPRDFVVGLTGQITPMITNDFHFSYLRHWWSYQRGGWKPQVAGTPDALEIGGENKTGALIPVNLDTQDTRWRIWNGHDWGYRDDVGWMTGNHLFQFGGSLTHYWIHHVRTDEVVGGVPSLVSQITSGALVMNGTYQPVQCTASNQPNCIPTNQLGSWNGDYADILGIVSQTNILVTRKGSNLSLQPFGTPVQDTDTYPYFNTYFNDVWHMTPSLTVNYGLTWAVEVAPTEANGNQTTLVDSSGHQIYMQQYLQNKLQAALAGKNYNPTVGFEPVGALGLTSPYKTDYHQFGPRFALSWNPNVSSGPLSSLFGNHEGVLRGGYSRIYNRLSGVSLVMTPLLGPSFGQTISCVGPNTSGQCTDNSTVNPTDAFRIGPTGAGFDGQTAPMPAISQTLTLPVEPGIGTTPASTFGFFLDPSYKPGYTDEWDVSYQRTVPGHGLLELGYVGNRSRNLYQGIDLSAVPWMMRQGGQAFNQAFINIYQQLKRGVKPAAIPNQPFFETALGGANSAYCSGFTSCTQAVLANEGTSPFTTDNVEQVWSELDSNWVFGPALPNTTQFPASLYGEGPFGWSNYNAGFINYNIRASHGLTLDTNFTYAHNFNTIGINQEYVLDTVENPWNIGTDYGPTYWDRKFTFNLLSLYNLPFGHGQNGFLNHVIGGWSVAPIWQWASGTPIEMYGGSWGETGSSSCCENGFTPIPLSSTKVYSAGSNVVTTGAPAASNSQCIACGGYGTNTGSGHNYFKNPITSFAAWRLPLVGLDTNSGGGGSFLRGLPHWNVNMTLAKTTNLSEGTRLQFTAQFFNIFNSMQWSDPFLDAQDPWDWGVQYGQANSPRNIELGLRLYW